jgi:hypothetical protein
LSGWGATAISLYERGDGKLLRRYWTTASQDCSLKSQYTTGPERRIPRWEHEHLLEAVQQRLDADPQAMRVRRETVEHPLAREGPYGSDTRPHQNASKSSRRDGSLEHGSGTSSGPLMAAIVA